ncbi:MAG: LptF/LptG family permease [Candidatus Omnitrophica bacterium]|nr:LptF/LptG family permease [Candidatus Omnitrophota bacterium]MBU1933177.1 LptF/LptG family permease [Candidatus Omnitrophota bacterium]
MKILKSYILKEITVAFLFSLLIFTFALVAGNLIKLADLVINKGVDIIEVGKLFLYLIPFLLSYTIPMSVLSAMLLVFGRLSSDNEIVAMRANGVNLYRLTVPLIIGGLLLSLFSIILNDRILPESHFASRKTVKNIGVKNPAAYLEAGTFIKSFRNYIIFIHEIDKNNLKGVRIYQLQEDRPTRTIIARKGEFITLENQNAVKLKLLNGTSDEPNPKNPLNFYKLNFNAYYLTLDLDESITSSGYIEKKPKEMNFREIKQEIKKLGLHHIDAPALIAEFHRKISISFASLVFVIIGISLGIFTKRGEKTIQFVIALGIIVLYYLLMAGGMAISLKGVQPIALWMYLPDIIIAAIGIILFRNTVNS